MLKGISPEQRLVDILRDCKDDTPKFIKGVIDFLILEEEEFNKNPNTFPDGRKFLKEVKYGETTFCNLLEKYGEERILTYANGIIPKKFIYYCPEKNNLEEELSKLDKLVTPYRI